MQHALFVLPAIFTLTCFCFLPIFALLAAYVLIWRCLIVRSHRLDKKDHLQLPQKTRRQKITFAISSPALFVKISRASFVIFFLVHFLCDFLRALFVDIFGAHLHFSLPSARSGGRM